MKQTFETGLVYASRLFMLAMVLFAMRIVADDDVTHVVEATGFGRTILEAEDDALRAARRQSPGLLDSDIVVSGDELIENRVLPFNNAIVESWERIGNSTTNESGELVQVSIRARIRNARGAMPLQGKNGDGTGSNPPATPIGTTLYAQITSRQDVSEEIGPVLERSFGPDLGTLFGCSIAVQSDGTPDWTFDPEHRTISVGVEVSVVDRDRFQEWANMLCDRMGRMCDYQDEVRFSGTMAKVNLMPKGAGGELRKRESFHANILGVYEYQLGLCFGVMVPRDGCRWDFSDSKNYFRLRRYYFHHDKNESILEAMGRLPMPSLAVRVVAKDPDGNTITEERKELPGSFLVARFRQGWRIMPGWTSDDGKSAVATYRTRVELGPFRDEDVDRISALESELDR